MAHAYAAMSRSTIGRRNRKLAGLAIVVSLLAMAVAAFIGAAICLHLYDVGATGAAPTVQHIANNMTTPFHHVFSANQFADPSNRYIAGQGLAAFVYLLAGLILGWVLHRLSWVGGRPVG